MARGAKVCVLALVALVASKGRVFVPAPARPTHPGVAAASVGLLGLAPAAYADKIDDAAKKLSEASYPFLKEIDWTSTVYGTVPTQKPMEVLKAVDKMIQMGAAMDGAARQAGALAHSKAIGSIDAKGVTTLADFTAINAALGHMVASAGEAKTMAVYNAIDGFKLGTDVGPYMMSKVSADDAKAAYVAFLQFKDAVKASM